MSKSDLLEPTGSVRWKEANFVAGANAPQMVSKLGVTLADVEATLDELYVSLRVWSGGMTEARREQVLDEVFGAA